VLSVLRYSVIQYLYPLSGSHTLKNAGLKNNTSWKIDQKTKKKKRLGWVVVGLNVCPRCWVAIFKKNTTAGLK